MRAILAIVAILSIAPDGRRADGSGPGRRARRAPASRRQAGAILAGQCVACHGPEKKKGGLDLSRRSSALAGGESGAAIVPGRPGESLLVEKVADGEMPPKGALSKEEVAAVRAWVEAGAPYPERAAVPAQGRRRLVVAPADPAGRPARGARGRRGVGPHARRCVRPRRARGRRAPAGPRGRPRHPHPPRLVRPHRPAADARAGRRVRRTTPSPLAYEALVDRLLASPHYGERWGRHWLDVVRFGESEGYETNLPRPSAWPYRDYVIRAFNRDTPFPRFVLEQLAGDTLAAADGCDWLTRAATGFLVGGTHDIVGNQTVEGMLQQRADDLDDMITATGTTFLGLTSSARGATTTSSTRSRQRDYYGLQAVFAGVSHGRARGRCARFRGASARGGGDRRRAGAAIDRRLDETEPLANPDSDAPTRPMVNPRRNVERFAPVRARMIRFTILATSNDTEPCIDELEVYSARDGEATPARNVALASAGGDRVGVVGVPGRPDPQDRAPQRRPPRQRPELDLAIAGQGGGHDRLARAGDDRPRGLGPRPRGRLPRPPGDPVLHRGGDRAGPLAGRRLVGRSRRLSRRRLRHGRVARRRRRRPSGPTCSRDGPRSASGSPDWARRCKVYAGTFSQPGPTHLLVRGDPTRKGTRCLRRRSRASGRGWCSMPAGARGRSAGPRWRGGSPTRPTRCRPG